MSVNGLIISGIILVTAGVLILIVSQLLLRRRIKQYNREWQEGADNYEVS